MTGTEKHKIAAFDFDGTSIQGNSPVLLVRHLEAHNMIRYPIILRILLWGAAYKLKLPQNEGWARSLVFTAFAGKPKENVDRYLEHFYDTAIEQKHRFRPQADAAMRRLHEQGVEVLVVSATFGPIVRQAQKYHPFDGCLCTEMKVDGAGNYTTQVDGECIEGVEKVRAITAYADAKYGPGEWELVEAYGDHHSDIPLLDAATIAHAVTPDHPLERLARRNGWDVVDWTIDYDRLSRREDRKDEKPAEFGL